MSRTKALTIFLLLLITLAFVNSAMAARGQVKLGDSEGIRRDYHGETGKLSFIGANPDSPIEIPGAMVQGLGPTSRSNEILTVYGPEFGLSNPSRELQPSSVQSQGNGRTSTRYQQMHQGIPILAGEIIVNQDSRGRLLSMNGEISPDLSISTTPTLTSREAADLALGVIAKQYGLDPSDLSISNPQLWIFDERLLRPSARPVELVWRTEVSGVDRPAIRELVLINAHTGGISLHFNQVDQLWSAQNDDQALLQPTETPNSCPAIVVVDSQLTASESTSRIDAFYWVDGNYSDWPNPWGPESAGYVTLNIAGQTWVRSTQVWVRTNSPTQPIEIGDSFGPSEIGSDFEDALNTFGWDALNFSLAIEDLCGQIYSQSHKAPSTPTPVPTMTATSDPIALISGGSGSENPGDQAVGVPIHLESRGGPQIAGLSVDMSFDETRLTVADVTTGSAVSAAGKSSSWSMVAVGTVRIIVAGGNQNVIEDGTVANIIFDVLPGAAPGSFTLSLSNATATDPGGGGVMMNSSDGSFAVLSPTATSTITPTDTLAPTSTVGASTTPQSKISDNQGNPAFAGASTTPLREIYDNQNNPAFGLPGRGPVLLEGGIIPGEWADKAAIPRSGVNPIDPIGGKACMGVTAINGYVYAIGGYFSDGTLSFRNQAYDPTTDTWYGWAGIPGSPVHGGGVACVGVAALNGKIYAVGGYYSDGTLSSRTDEYIPSPPPTAVPGTNLWNNKADLPQGGRACVGVAATNGRIYAVGGYYSDGSVSDRVQEYDPATNTWTSKADIPGGGRACISVAALSGKIYAVGGYNSDGTVSNRVQEFDPLTNTWTSKADIPSGAQACMAVTASDGQIHTIGGYYGDGTTSNRAQAYNPTTNTWENKEDLPFGGRGCAGAAAVNGKIYAVGGYYTDGTVSDRTQELDFSIGTSDVFNAYDYSGDTYNFYLIHHGRDSLDNAGMKLISTVRYCPNPVSCPEANAGWSGSLQQMFSGDGWTSDDLVGHELTHGATQFTSNLFYYYQSGAINESFSDLWGEFIDLTNSSGTDTAGVKWLIFEDVPGGPYRDMEDPPAKGDPDKMTNANYWFDETDNGGVHTNSGVNNKAVYLLTDGGSFNGYTVSGLGIDKVAAIYYEVQTNLITSGSDYRDLYNALYQGCLNLIPGPQGITTVDCQQVRYATEAVEMNLEPSAGFNPDVEICQGGGQPIDLFFDDVESGGSNWGTGVVSGSSAWFIGSFYATSPVSSLLGDDSYASSDSFIAMISDVALPGASQPYLHFNHAFGFEDPDWDGGWLEYSINGGVSWNDAIAMFDGGLNYTGTISTDWDNPNGGHPAFVGDSHGYVSSRYDLSSLAGQNIRFRWRMSTDSLVYDWGWFVDDIRIFSCGSPASAPVFTDVPADYWARDYIEILYNEGYIAGCQSSPPKYCPHRVLNRAESAVFVMRGAYGAIPDPPYPPPSTPSFDDVDPAYWGYGWIESMWTDGFTAGCGTDPLIYCPLRDHTRAEGSVFFLRIKNGVAYNPPPPVGIFADVSLGAWYDGWVEAAYSEGLLPPCQTDPLKFCPDDTLDRSWAAYMMVWAKGGYGLPAPTLVPTSTSTPTP